MAHSGALPDRLDWDHVRVFLSTLRAKSLRRAAEELGLSHPTARRHLNAFEQELGLRLFDRRPDGLHATPEAAALRGPAEQVERAMQALGRVAMAADPQLRGPIRVTLPGALATDLLMPDFAEFQRNWPDIELQLLAGYSLADLDRREADVAIRAMAPGKLPDGHLTGRKVGTSNKAIYGRGDCWIGWRGAREDAAWVAETPFADLPIRGALNDPALQRTACQAGMGLTMLPCFFADPLLERRTPPVPANDVWVLVHPDLRDNPRLRVFRDFITQAIRGYADVLEGRLSS
jgi:DNA-binding transcriptional LysR family regulator